MAEEDGMGVGRRGFIRDAWRGGGISEGGLRGGRGGVMPFEFVPSGFSLSRRNGLCVTFCG